MHTKENLRLCWQALQNNVFRSQIIANNVSWFGLPILRKRHVYPSFVFHLGHLANYTSIMSHLVTAFLRINHTYTLRSEATKINLMSSWACFPLLCNFT
jgi:hypothetical protein